MRRVVAGDLGSLRQEVVGVLGVRGPGRVVGLLLTLGEDEVAEGEVRGLLGHGGVLGEALVIALPIPLLAFPHHDHGALERLRDLRITDHILAFRGGHRAGGGQLGHALALAGVLAARERDAEQCEPECCISDLLFHRCLRLTTGYAQTNSPAPLRAQGCLNIVAGLSID